MIRLYIAGAVIVAFAGLSGLVWVQNKQLDAKASEIVSLKAEKAALEASAQKEAEIQTVTRTVYRTVERVKHEISTVDPQCANEGAFVAAWSSGIDRVRQAGTSPDHAPAVNALSVPVTGQDKR